MGPVEVRAADRLRPLPVVRRLRRGYAATIPSKFISADGRSMWLQSNCFGAAHACSQNFFSLRKLTVTTE